MKKDDSKIRYCVQHENHARVVFSALCSLMEHQSLVDLAIRCGNNTIHAHKCILAANSPYFREQLEKNVFTEQVVVTGIDFSVMKAVVEFMYCGETQVLEDHLKQLAAVAKLFQIRGLPGVAPDHIEADNASFLIPPPIFLSKKPKYSSTYGYIPYANPPNNTFNNNPGTNSLIHTSLPISPNTISTTNISSPTPTIASTSSQQQSIVEHSSDNSNVYNILNNDPIAYNRRMKRKCVRTEAEKACAKEAAASRLALETIQKELATTSFNLSDDHSSNATNVSQTQQQYVNTTYGLGQQNLLIGGGDGISVVGLGDTDKGAKLASPETAAEKIKHMFGQELPSNVEIMFKTSDGNFVNVTDEMLQAITKEALQFQVIDENGQASEIQFLKHDEKSKAIPVLPTILQPETQNLHGLDSQVPRSTIGTITNCSNHEDFVFLNTQPTSVHQQQIQLADIYRQKTNQSIDVKLLNDTKPHVKSASNSIPILSPTQHEALIDANTSIVEIDHSDLFTNIKVLTKNTQEPKKKNITDSDRDVMFVEGIGNVVCSETVRKEDDVFFEVNPRYYGGDDSYNTSPKRKIAKSNCEVQDMIISPKKPAEKLFPNFSLVSNFDDGNCSISENNDKKSINNM